MNETSPKLSNSLYLLSGIMTILSLALLPSFGLSLLNRDEMRLVFGLSLATLAALAILLRILKFRPSELSLRDGFFITALSWITISILGSIPFLASGYFPDWIDALFESISGFTTTGATVLEELESLPASLLLWRSTTHWLGGMGVIALAVAIFPLMGASGYQLFRAEIPGPSTEKLAPRIKTTAGYLWLIYSGLTLLQFGLLLVGGMPGFDALITALGTMATGGVSNKNANLAAFDSPYLQYVVIFFMFLASVSFTLHFKALRGKPRSYFRDPEFRFYGLLILGATVFVIANRLLTQGGEFSEACFRSSLFSVVSLASTTGFVTESYELWPLASQVLLFGLMLIGASTGSTAGGIKCVRIQLSLKYILTELRKMIHQSSIHLVRLGKEVFPENAIPNVIAFVLLFFVIFFFGVLIMAGLGLDLKSALGSVAASLGNVGTGFGSVGPGAGFATIGASGKLVLAGLMLLGRLELWTVLLLFSRRFWVN